MTAAVIGAAALGFGIVSALGALVVMLAYAGSAVALREQQE